MSNHHIQGILWKILQCFIFTCMLVVIRLLSESGMNLYSILFWQNSIVMIYLLVPLIAFHKKKYIKKTEKMNLFFSRAFLGVLSGVMLFHGTANVEVNMATAISFSYPIFASFFAIVILGEVVRLPRMIALFIGFVGVFIVLKPWSDSFNNYAIYIVIAAFIWGITDTIIKRIVKTEGWYTNLFYSSLFMFILTIPMGFVYWHPPTTYQILLLLLMAFLQLSNYSSVIFAYKKADITILMPFDFFRLVFSAIISYMVFSERLDNWTFTGSFLILASSVYATYRERKLHKRGEKLLN